MNRYNVETADRYDMEPAPEGMWVMHDDVQAAIAAAVAAERERCAKVCEAMISRAPTSTSYADYLVITALQDASELIRKV